MADRPSDALLKTAREMVDAGLTELVTIGILTADHGDRLYGEGGCLDSMGIASLLVAVEDQIAQTTSRRVVLANDRAFSVERSPFATADSLAAFVAEEIA